MPNPVQHSKPLPPLHPDAYRHKTPSRLFESLDERLECGESYQPQRREPEQLYPCNDCGALRTKAQGGTTFTVCDECWDKAYASSALAQQDERSPCMREDAGSSPAGSSPGNRGPLPIGASAPDEEGSAREPGVGECPVDAEARELTGQRAPSGLPPLPAGCEWTGTHYVVDSETYDVLVARGGCGFHAPDCGSRDSLYDALADALGVSAIAAVRRRDGWERFSFHGVPACIGDGERFTALTGCGRVLEHEARVLAAERAAADDIADDLMVRRRQQHERALSEEVPNVDSGSVVSDLDGGGAERVLDGVGMVRRGAVGVYDRRAGNHQHSAQEVVLEQLDRTRVAAEGMLEQCKVLTAKLREEAEPVHMLALPAPIGDVRTRCGKSLSECGGYVGDESTVTCGACKSAPEGDRVDKLRQCFEAQPGDVFDAKLNGGFR